MLRSAIAVMALSCCPLLADLTTEQRVADFQAISGLYARYYAPASWKILALGVNIFDIEPWLTRVRAAKSDVEYLQICAEYVGSFRDGHARFFTPSTFRAEIGLFTDIYDGWVLVDGVDRTLYPVSQYPFKVGDAVVSVDGVAAMDIVRELSKVTPLGTPRATYRNAADFMFFRPQSVFPKAAELGDAATVVIRDENGVDTIYSLPWIKTGYPLIALPGVPQRAMAAATADSTEVRKPKVLTGIEAFNVEAGRLARTIHDESGNAITRGDTLGWGAATPYYALPTGFLRRRNGLTDFFFSGTYTSEGQRIGLIRIPHFSPGNEANAIREFENEILFFHDNTDGLVVDVSRNTGGGCVGVEWATRLMPAQFQIVQRQYRPWFDLVSSHADAIEQLRDLGATGWVMDRYQFIFNTLAATAKVPGAMTGFLPRCDLAGQSSFTAPSEVQLPARNAAGQIIAYDKPIIFLGDDLSASFADSFLADMQDNKRGLIVGTRTSGLGGTRGDWTNVGPFSESTVTITIGINGRNRNVAAPGLPTSPYIENVGVFPDIELDYMTQENLKASGRVWVDGFTRIVIEEIRKSKTQ